MVTVTAKLKVKPGVEKATKDMLVAVLETVRGEDGCICYDFHTHTEDATAFLFYERWESKAHLDAHLETKHMKAVFDKLELAEPPQIELWDLHV